MEQYFNMEPALYMLGLKRIFTEIGIDRANFSVMAKKACGDSVLTGFNPLAQEDIEKIFEMCP